MLIELKGGELLINPRSGRVYRVHRVRKGRRDTGYIENLFRLECIVLGSREWTQEELDAEGLKEYKP